jgi:hypothetical protein
LACVCPKLEKLRENFKVFKNNVKEKLDKANGLCNQAVKDRGHMVKKLGKAKAKLRDVADALENINLFTLAHLKEISLYHRDILITWN